MVRKIKIGIIGAGPSAIAAAIPFLKEKNKFEVNMISSGESLFTEEVINLQNYLKSLDRDSQHKYWENKEYTSKELIPKKLFFGKTKVYNDVEDDLEVSSQLTLRNGYLAYVFKVGDESFFFIGTCAFRQGQY